MQRLILGLVDGEPGEIRRQRGPNVNVEADLVTTFEGEALVEGRAAGTVTHDVTVPVVHDQSITTDVEERTEDVLTEFLADLDAESPYVAVDSADGTFLWEWLTLEWGAVPIERAQLDVDAIADRLRDLDRAEIWQVGWNREGGESVGINYHRDATLRTNSTGLTQIGFRAEWGGGLFEGTLAQSGYIAEFSGATVEQIAAWVRSEILPHASIPEDDEDDQTTLDGGAP